MSINKRNWYDFGEYIAEWYDQTQTNTDDVNQIRRLIGDRVPLRILEPFCGSGRILLSLVADGHEGVGFDQAEGMVDRARAKIAQMPEDARQRVSVFQADAVAGGWPIGFDLVLLAANCFYELGSPEEQEACVASAAASLRPGGYVYVDNDHMEGGLAESWRKPGRHKSMEWTAGDGTRIEWGSETIWYDAPGRIWRAKRYISVTRPDGKRVTNEWTQQKHPVSCGEVRGWLENHGFEIEKLFGSHSEDIPYTDECSRATFWARRVK